MFVSDGQEYYCEKHDIYNQSCNISFSSLNQMQLNVPEPVEPRESANTFPDSDEDYPTENNLNQTDFSHTKPIVIESEHTKHEKFHTNDSANHSFDDGMDVVDGFVPKPNGVNGFGHNDQKKQPNSVDSGISNNVNGDKLHINGSMDVDHKEVKIANPMTSRLSDASLKEKDAPNNVDCDENMMDCDVSPRQKNQNVLTNGTDKKNGVSLNLKLQNEMRYVECFMFMLINNKTI